MSTAKHAARQTFASLRIRNFRVYILAQLVSISGTWMQSVAQAWLVLRLSNSGVALGLVVGLQFLPTLCFGPVGGLVADRFSKRHVLFATQTAGGLLGLALGILVVTHTVRLWQVFVLAAGLGFVNLFDNPARQSFVLEMVGRESLPNAVSLNTVMVNASRVVGPAIGGLIITFWGLSACFFVNAASYLAVIIGLAMMRRAELLPTEPVARARGQIRDGFRYVWATPRLRTVLVAVAVVGIFAYNFSVTLALFAERTFHGGAGTYSLLTSCMGFGAVMGGLLVAHRSRPTARLLQVTGLIFGGLLVAVAFAPALGLAAGLILLMGGASMAFLATANATLQLTADPAMRGRVMSLYAMAFLGTTPIGAPLVGWIAHTTNPRMALLAGGLATLAAAVYLLVRLAPTIAPTPASEAETAREVAAEAEAVGEVERLGTQAK
jgi:MFS family permease